MKTTLTIEQSAELIKRGVTKDKASKLPLCATSPDESRWSEPIFTLTDILSILPKVLHKDGLAYHYVLTIYWDEDIKAWRAMYDAIGDNIAGDCAAPELIDALFALIISLLDNHVKLD